MEKAERRRRRRRFDQEAGADEPAATVVESAEDAPGEVADIAPAAEPEQQPSATGTPEELLAAAATALAPEGNQAEVPPEQAAAPRPAAMAEVIGAGFPRKTRAATAEKESAAPDVDPFFQRAVPRTELRAAETAAAPAAQPEPEEPSPPPPRLRDAAPHPQPSPPQPRPSARDPVLLALLLAALVVLAIDTYFILRLNGLYDRLSATGAKPSVATAAPATARPWIGIGSIKTAPFANGGQPVTTVRFGNSGSEPAYDFRSNTVGSLRPSGSPPPDIPAKPGPVASAGVLVPNAEGILTFFANTRALTADEAGRVRSGQLVLWLAGRLDYRDPHGKQRLTTFRYRYDPSLNNFVAAPQGNAAS